MAALLLVLGLRLAPPRSLAGAAASVGYAASLAATLLGALRVLPGPSPAAPLPLRLAGIAALVAGLLLAGRFGRSGRRAPAARGTAPAAPLAYAGLALVLLGQLLRAPSAAGALALAAAALAHGWAAWSARRTPAGV